MARFEIQDIDSAVLGAAGSQGDIFYTLGMMYATGSTVPTDRVEAHKWFNLAAMKGNDDAKRLRRELAAEMNEIEIAAAQRAAREWLTTH